MISFTPSPGPDRGGRSRRPAGFTLVELMIGATISSFVLAGILSVFLFMGRSGANVSNYNDMETQARNALEIFAQDARQASTITWHSKSSLTLRVEGVNIQYTFDSGALIRITPTQKRAIVTGVVEFEFKPFSITGAELGFTNLTATSRDTKQLQISLRAARKSQTVVAATNTVLSARFILRNKRVTA
jgi:Tfp pilus assembly protein PilW